MWNFYDVESIDFNNLNVKGFVFVFFVDIMGGLLFDGFFVVELYIGVCEFYNFVFNYECEVSVVEVLVFYLSLFLIFFVSILMVICRFKVIC